MKKYLFFLLFFSFLLSTPILISAQTEVLYPVFSDILSPQDIVQSARDQSEIFPLFMSYLFRLVIIVSLMTVLGVVLYGGILYFLSTGNPIKTHLAREWILSAIQGLFIILGSYALLFALDTQLVLFQLDELDQSERLEKVNLEWEIRNTYFQIPFGLLIEDAILNENAKNKLYDVLDATNRAEAVAEAIYQASVQLLAIIESCPVGMPCGGGSGVPIPPPTFTGYPPPDQRDAQNSNIPPPQEASEVQAQEDYQSNEDEGGSGEPYLYKTTEGTFELYYQAKEGDDQNFYPIESHAQLEQIDTTKYNIFKELVEPPSEEINFESEPRRGISFSMFKKTSLLTGFNVFDFFHFIFTQIPYKNIAFANNNAYWDGAKIGFKTIGGPIASPQGDLYVVDIDRNSLSQQLNAQGKSDLSGYLADDVTWFFNPETKDLILYQESKFNDILTDPDNLEWFAEELLGWQDGAEVGLFTSEEEEGEEESGEEEAGEEEAVEEEAVEEEIPEERNTNECCSPCPNIAPAVQAKIAEIEGYFPVLLARLADLLETKEPIKEDLYQLYKAVMIKTLGNRHITSYTSLLIERRYYEKDEILIKTDDTRTEIQNYSGSRTYFWDWSQWLYNTLYRIKVDGRIVEENDPATFYLREPHASKIVRDATSLAMDAKLENIQDAGNRLGIPRYFPPAPPDIGSQLYPPANPETTRLTSPFGVRYDPFTGERVIHQGLDLAGPRNTPIYAAEDGEVVFAGWAGTETTGYGKLIVLYHRATSDNNLNQDIVTYYGHLEPDSIKVSRGDTVSRGEHIAGMGTTGRSTGYHIHYEVRINVSYPFKIHTGEQVDPASYLNIDLWSFIRRDSPSSSFSLNPSYLLQGIVSRLCIQSASAQSYMETLMEYLRENNIDHRNLTDIELQEIINSLGIDHSALNPVGLTDITVKSPSDYIMCGMEIPIGETFELTWHHLVELLDTIDYYIAEGERLIQQQTLMNNLARPCSCPCVGDCCDCVCTDSEGNTYPCPVCGGCELTCNLGAIRAAHAEVAATREVMRQIAAHIKLLTDGHFNTPTEDVCDPLNEDIRDNAEKIFCQNGGSKLITKHELITRKLNYSRFSLDECNTRPEQMEDVLSGARAGKALFFGPLAEETLLPRYTKTRHEDGFVINTSDLNWFCCSDSRFEEE